MIDWGPVLLTLRLAATTTVILFIIGVPLAYWISLSRSILRPLAESVISLPLVLPPTVLGFYLLVAFSPNSAAGHWLNEIMGIQLVFSFPGLVVGSVIYSLPFMINPIASGISNLPDSYIDAARIMGKSRLSILLHVLIPNIYPSLLTAVIMTFAHTMGEFGVVLMIGGNIPGETRVASIAIFDKVEALEYGSANQYALILIAITFIILIGLHFFNRRSSKQVIT